MGHKWGGFDILLIALAAILLYFVFVKGIPYYKFIDGASKITHSIKLP